MRGCCWYGGLDPCNSSSGYIPMNNNSSGPQCYYSNIATQDLYFFGHGHNYKLAISEFTTLAGSIPLPPRYIFGVFFSRYWAYNEPDEKQIIKEYAIEHMIPLDVLVIDMDWHKTFYKAMFEGQKDQAGESPGK